MKVGVPKGLLYYKYHPFICNFLNELGTEVITSEDTNKSILDKGVKYCTDEACLPIKIFHGHVASIRDKCDIMIIPRIMQLRKREFICPKFCGLPEMIINSIPDMPSVISSPIYAYSDKKLYEWVSELGHKITKNNSKIHKAFINSLRVYNNYESGIKDEEFKFNVALVGHPYNIYDSFSNMNIIKKLNTLGIGVITEEYVESECINNEVKKLFKKPFWSFAKNSYGFSTYLIENKKINGIIYISSFACGIDSIVVELIKDRIGCLPFLVLKIDEHTGEAGIDTRIEAFQDMLERRKRI